MRMESSYLWRTVQIVLFLVLSLALVLALFRKTTRVSSLRLGPKPFFFSILLIFFPIFDFVTWCKEDSDNSNTN